MKWAVHPRFGFVEVLDESPNLVRIARAEDPDDQFWVPKAEIDELIDVSKHAA